MSALDLLRSLIRTPSYSGEENKTAKIIADYLSSHQISFERVHNNIFAFSKNYNPDKPTILLNSHHDTVKVNEGWTFDPFGAEIVDNFLYGRGSNDAGGALVGLIDTFIDYHEKELPFNLILAATGEEENFGSNGLSSLLQGILPPIHFGIIGEPTSLELGAAQKGLIVLDGKIKGKAGHAARANGINAIYLALEDIQTIKEYEFSKMSTYLGPTTAQLTMIHSGSTHNVIPDVCQYVLDVRVNDCYTLLEVVDELQKITKADLLPRSLRWHARGLPVDHPILSIANDLKIKAFGSPTLSDQVHCNFPTVKIGPGDSERSHTSDEYIKIPEIYDGINIYKSLVKGMAQKEEFINYCKNVLV